jgi:hypothetical protein
VNINEKPCTLAGHHGFNLFGISCCAPLQDNWTDTLEDAQKVTTCVVLGLKFAWTNAPVNVERKCITIQKALQTVFTENASPNRSASIPFRNARQPTLGSINLKSFNE